MLGCARWEAVQWRDRACGDRQGCAGGGGGKGARRSVVEAAKVQGELRASVRAVGSLAGVWRVAWRAAHMIFYWSGRWESNPRHTAWEAVVLPLNYARKWLPDPGRSSFSLPGAAHDQTMAERGRFELPIQLPVCRISSAVLSTTQPPLRNTRRTRERRLSEHLGISMRSRTRSRADQPARHGPAAGRIRGRESARPHRTSGEQRLLQSGILIDSRGATLFCGGRRTRPQFRRDGAADRCGVS